MSKYCDKCFVNTDKEQHKDWCPNKPQELEDMFGGVFKDIFNTKDKNKNEDDSKRD